MIMAFLRDWQNFYMIVGTAAATLTGLMFVVTTLIAGLDTHVSTLNAAVSAFNTPIVMHFCSVLVLAGIFSAPWQSVSSISLLLGVLSLGMAAYMIIVLRRMMRVPNYQSTPEDWSWYVAFPLLAHLTLVLAAWTLTKDPSLALYMVGSAMILLLLAGIRNAWDMVTFLAVERSHSQHEHNNKNVEVQEAGKTGRARNKPGR
jgi:hypothetical protein